MNHDARSDTQKNSRTEMQEYDFCSVSLIDAYYYVPHDEEARFQNKKAGVYSKVKAAPKIKTDLAQAPRFSIN